MVPGKRILGGENTESGEVTRIMRSPLTEGLCPTIWSLVFNLGAAQRHDRVVSRGVAGSALYL